MPTLVLSFAELMFLAALAPQRPAHTFPLQHLLGREKVLAPAEIKKIHDHFLQEGLLWQDKDGVPYLNGELAVVFSILNDPEEVLHLRAFARPETPRYILCARKGRWIVVACGRDDSFFAVTYLYSLKDCARWFSFDLLGREEFAGPYFPEQEICLTSFELALLAVLQGIYKGRVEQKGSPLEEAELQVAWEALLSPESWVNAQRVLPYELDAGKFAGLFRDRDAVRAAAESLAQKQILETGAGGAAFTLLARTIFDPGKVMNMFICTKPGLVNRYKTLQVYREGWLILRPLYQERGQVGLQLLPGSVSGEEIFYRLRTFERVALAAGAAAPAEAAPAGAGAAASTGTARGTGERGPAPAPGVPPAREEGWYLYQQEQQYGPYSWQQLRQFAREGRLGAETLLWHEELGEWQQAAGVEGLFQ